MDTQQILPLILQQDADSELIIGESNRLAVRTVLCEPWMGHVVYLYGEEGCGKTLLASLWATKHAALWIDTALHDAQLTAITTGAYVLNELHITEVQYQVQLFHLLNIIKETHSQLLLCSRLPPAQLPVTLIDLSSRLRALQVAHILPPDDDMLRGLIIQQLAEKQLRVEAGVIQYLLLRLPRSFAATIAMVERLDSLSLQKHRAITLPLARQALEDVAN